MTASRVAPPSLEPVTATPRASMTPKRRLEVLMAANDRCAHCGARIEAEDAWIANHRVPLAMGGADALENLEPRHLTCDRVETPADLSRIAKAKRQARLRLDVEAEPSRRPIRSRGFDRRLRKRMDGTVEAR